MVFKFIFSYRLSKLFLKCEGRFNRNVDVLGANFILIGTDTTIDKCTRIYALESYNEQKFSPKITIGNDTLIGRDYHIS